MRVVRSIRNTYHKRANTTQITGGDNHTMGCLTLISAFLLGFIGFLIPVQDTSTTASVTETQTVTEPRYAGIPQTRADDGAYILGFEDAPVTIVAFEDFLCPHCQTYQDTLKAFIDTYVASGQAKFEFRMLPISQRSPAVFALAECAEELRPGTFWQAHDLLFQLASDGPINSEAQRQFAEILMLDNTDLLDCQPTKEQYTADVQLARILGVNATPTIMVRYGDLDPVRTGNSRPDLAALGEIVQGAQ